MKKIHNGSLLVLAMLFAHVAAAQEATGTLLVEVKPFSSEKELPAKVDKQLRSGAIEWGVRDDQLVFTMVNKRYVDFPINHMTRYGQAETLALPAGDYRITGIGLEMTTSLSVEKMLDKGAYVNEDVLRFHIAPGQTTRLEINPKIERDATFWVNFYLPTLYASTGAADQAQAAPPVALNARGEGSIEWPRYQGPLKYVTR